MICSVINEPSVPILLSASNSPASSFALHSSGDQLPKEPYVYSHALHTHQSQEKRGLVTTRSCFSTRNPCMTDQILKFCTLLLSNSEYTYIASLQSLWNVCNYWISREQLAVHMVTRPPFSWDCGVWLVRPAVTYLPWSNQVFSHTGRLLFLNVSFSFRGNILMSQKRQRRLSGYGFINVGLPPASPAGSEDDDVRVTC